MAGIVHVTDFVNTRAMAFNGDGATVEEALENFYSRELAGGQDLDELLEGQAIQIVGHGRVSNDSLDVRVQDKDTITLVRSEVATGGFKGATR